MITFKINVFQTVTLVCSGEDLGISRGGRISQNFWKFCLFDLFLRSTKLTFRAFPKELFCPYFGKIFCAAGRTLKKQAKKKIFFWKILTKKLCFLSARAPLSKLVYIGTEGAFRKFVGSITKKWILENSTKGDPLGRHGVESLREENVRIPSPPPKSAPKSAYFEFLFKMVSAPSKKLHCIRPCNFLCLLCLRGEIVLQKQSAETDYIAEYQKTLTIPKTAKISWKCFCSIMQRVVISCKVWRQ